MKTFFGKYVWHLGWSEALFFCVDQMSLDQTFLDHMKWIPNGNSSPVLKEQNFWKKSIIFVNKIIYFLLHIFFTCLLRLSFLENVFKQMVHTNSDFDFLLGSVTKFVRFLLFGIKMSVSSVSSIRLDAGRQILHCYHSGHSVLSLIKMICQWKFCRMTINSHFPVNPQTPFSTVMLCHVRANPPFPTICITLFMDDP